MHSPLVDGQLHHLPTSRLMGGRRRMGLLRTRRRQPSALRYSNSITRSSSRRASINKQQKHRSRSISHQALPRIIYKAVDKTVNARGANQDHQEAAFGDAEASREQRSPGAGCASEPHRNRQATPGEA